MSQESVMSDENIRQLTKQLPEPISTCIIGEALFDLYKAKDLYSEDWNDPALYEFLLEARKSYYVYDTGRPIFDEYEPKSAVYLVRAIYPLSVSGTDHLVEEWLSYRFIPYEGNPLGAGEMDLFLYKRKRVDYWLPKLLFKGYRDFLKHTITGSRMCGIHPYFQIGEGEFDSGFKLPQKHRYTALCHALMHDQFWNECEDSGLVFKYFSIIVPDEIVRKMLSIEVDGRKVSVELTPAYKALGARGPEDVKLDRYTQDLFAYRFPTYFLNLRQLANVLKRLVAEGRLSDSTIQHYMNADMTLDALLESGKPLRTLLGGAGNMLTENGRLRGSTLTGSELRKIADIEVDDDPELKITEVKVWVESIKQVLSFAGMGA